MRNSILFIVIAGMCLLVACKKESIAPADCQRLQNGIIASDKEEVKAVINKTIAGLSSRSYTGQNLTNLTDAISRQCGVFASVTCFDCIKTLPSQSEIRISCPAPGGTVEKTVDITYTATNEMIFNNLHY